MTGFIMAYTAPDGTSYPLAYWYPRQISFDPALKSGNIQYMAYASQAAFSSDANAIIPYIGANKTYQLSADVINAFMISANLSLSTLLSPVDEFALSVKDTDESSFFAGGEQV